MKYANNDGSRRGASFLGKNSLMNTRARTIELVRANPGVDLEDLFDKFIETIASAEDHQSAINWYFFINASTCAQGSGRTPEEITHRSSPRDYERAPVTIAQRAERQEKVSAAATQIVNQISLLFLTMPNGKAMRYCTGREMEKFGKGYAKIAKRAGTKTVGEVLNEAEVRQLMDTP